jgi:hypothetical protein
MPIALHHERENGDRGWWVASCATCGQQLAVRRDQQTAETIGKRTRCQVCGTRTPAPRRRR